MVSKLAQEILVDEYVFLNKRPCRVTKTVKCDGSITLIGKDVFTLVPTSEKFTCSDTILTFIPTIKTFLLSNINTEENYIETHDTVTDEIYCFDFDSEHELFDDVCTAFYNNIGHVMLSIIESPIDKCGTIKTEIIDWSVSKEKQ